MRTFILFAVLLLMSACASTVHMHVSYNILTNGHSKEMIPVGNEIHYVLVGETADYKYFRCSVSKDFYDIVHENKFFTIPAAKCVEVEP